MSYCYVANSIARHCSNEYERFCPECGANMYIKEDNEPDLLCSECGLVIDPLEDNEEY